MPLSGFDPLIAEWFERRFGQPTEPQRHGWPQIRSGRDVLISAPTGSGKTFAAFLLCLDGLVREARGGPLPDETITVYVSPLKALSNDIQRNLEGPLAEICQLAAQKGLRLAPIRTAVRTGDTKPWERQRMSKTPPHILVTTPESLFILLTARKTRQMLRTVRTLIVDEIHAVADDKRGSHLALSVERLEALVSEDLDAGPRQGARAPGLQRIGLSATVKPIDEVSRFLSRRFESGQGSVVQIGHQRPMKLAVEVPNDELGAVASNEIWDEIYDRLTELIGAHRTTLIFVNTRRLAERLTHNLQERLGEDVVMAHHGSLSRSLRLAAEQRLKQGDLRAVVATASLELGIDIGTVDLVCQIGSPRSIAVALQRIGRSGHWAGAIPQGRLFATTRDELIECAALVRAIRNGELDRLEIPGAPLDVLAQQIVAEAACREFGEDELFDFVRRAYPFRNLSRQDFDAIIEMLAEGISTARGRSGAYLHRDQVHGRLRARRGARLAAITSGGAIPDTAQYLVVAEPEATTVGMVDEDFAVESMAGDVFLLGTTSWRIRRVEPGRVRVEDAHGAAPTIPFWRGEAPGRTFELSREVSRLREDIDNWSRGDAPASSTNGHSTKQADKPVSAGNGGRPAPSAADRLIEQCGLNQRAAEQVVEYVAGARAALGVVPTWRTIVAERFFDEAGGMQLIVHAPFGSRINRAWGLALRKRFCRSFNLELQAAATDNGINISLTEQHAFPLELVFEFLQPETLEHVLTQALLDSPMFTVRWRWNASRALAVLRFSGGRKVPPPIQRMRAEDLLAATFPDQAACAENLTGEIRIPGHPLVKETIGNCLHEAMDLGGLHRILEQIRAGEIRTASRETPEPSPFSHEILNANPYAFLDDAPLEERRARAVQMRRGLGPELADGAGALDPAAIARVAEEAWPVVRDADELHDALLSLVMLPPVPAWEAFYEQLQQTRRATTLHREGHRLWVAAERLALAQTLHPDAQLNPVIAAVTPAREFGETREAFAAEVLRGWLDSSGPTTASSLAARLALPPSLIETALLQLESEGQVLRGRFSPGTPQTPSDSPEETASAGSIEPETEWCNRRVLARIHRLTLGRLRSEIDPVSSADFMRFLCRWQHLAPGTQLHGVDGALQIIKQLQGFEISAAAWEAQILPRRIVDYEPELLDRLCLAGEVMWGRLSPHPAFDDFEAAGGGPENGQRRGLAAHHEGATNGKTRVRRVRPTRVAPISLLLREDAAKLLPGIDHPSRGAAAVNSEQASERGIDPPNAASNGSLSHPAREVLEGLERRGASFFADLVRITKRLPSEVENGLWELVAAGLVTADGFENLRALIDPKRRRGEGRGRAARPRHAAGRWALLREAVHAERAEPRPEPNRQHAVAEPTTEAFALQLLARWGVVFRDLLRRETLAPPWRDLLVVLRRMEARGQVRGGRFVSAFGGEHFALPEAVAMLRAVRRAEPGGEEIVLAAADPLNLVGIVLPGPKVSSAAAETLRLRDGALMEEPSSLVLTLARSAWTPP